MIEELIVLAAATWRISYLFLFDEGPWDILARIRNRFGVYYEVTSEGFQKPAIDFEKANFITPLFTCMNCMSIWFGIFFAINYFFFPRPTILFAIPFALSAGALLIDKFIDGG